MRWSWKIGTISGIGIYVNVSFLVLIALVVMLGFADQKSVGGVLQLVALILVLFGIIVLHELGHALTARRFGIRTQDITLLLFGGVARLERMPRQPWQEFLIAVAGPAVNVVLAVLLSIALIGLAVLSYSMQWNILDSSVAMFLFQLISINVMLVLFNMLPAFPMDGGRVLRAVLASKLDYVRATNIAANVGQAMAVLFGLMGLIWFNPFLVFIALFVWMGAAQEASSVRIRSAVSGIPVSRVMVTDFQVLAPDDELSRAVNFVLAGFQHDFPVIDEGKFVGVLTRADMVKALAEQGQYARVATVMRTDIKTADASEMLEPVIPRLQSAPGRTLPVVKDGQIVGMLTTENLGEFLMVDRALRQRITLAGQKPIIVPSSRPPA